MQNDVCVLYAFITAFIKSPKQSVVPQRSTAGSDAASEGMEAPNLCCPAQQLLAARAGERWPVGWSMLQCAAVRNTRRVLET